MNGPLIVVQARLASTRLPRKVLLPLFREERVIDIVLKRCARAGEVLLVVPRDEPEFMEIAERNGVKLFMGDPTDVLARFARAMCRHNGNTIVRITADCPLVSPDLIAKAVRRFDCSDYHYLSNAHPARTATKGFDIEVFSRPALELAACNAAEKMQREHVTPWMYESGRLIVGTLHDTEPFTSDNLSIDTNEDYLRVRAIFERFGNTDFEHNDVRSAYN